MCSTARPPHPGRERRGRPVPHEHRKRPQIFVTGHPEYDKYTLDAEYKRDVGKGLPIAVPKNYYPNDDPEQPPLFRWRAHAHLLYENWLNYYVYQNTPYDLGSHGARPARGLRKINPFCLRDERRRGFSWR